MIRWFDYKSFGEVIADTQIIAVKTPLKKVRDCYVCVYNDIFQLPKLSSVD